MKEKPEAIIINVPEAFFKHKGKIEGDREEAFRKFYETMGTGDESQHYHDTFYHFISKCPVHQVTHAFICFKGKVQYKAFVVEYLKNQPVELRDYSHPEPRDWLVTTGPVEKPPHDIPMKGFRGFRYTSMLF